MANPLESEYFGLMLLLLVLVFGFGLVLGSYVCSFGDLGDITVNVVDGDNNPINQATVTLEGGSSNNVGSGGAYTYEDVEYGTYDVTASAPNYESKTVSVTVDEATETITIVLQSEGNDGDNGDGDDDPSKPEE